MDAAELGAELSRAFSAHPFLSTVKGTKTVMRILEVRGLARAALTLPPLHAAGFHVESAVPAKAYLMMMFVQYLHARNQAGFCVS